MRFDTSIIANRRGGWIVHTDDGYTISSIAGNRISVPAGTRPTGAVGFIHTHPWPTLPHYEQFSIAWIPQGREDAIGDVAAANLVGLPVLLVTPSGMVRQLEPDHPVPDPLPDRATFVPNDSPHVSEIFRNIHE